MTGVIRIGTSGWSYGGWVGSFYPAEVKSETMLDFYLKNFTTVEINNTFYNLPRPVAVKKWHDKVSADFIFACKASRYLTHRKKLKEPEEGLKRFFKAIEPLAEKTGPILFQLPPRWRKNVERLAGFLELLPEGFRYTFEFRDQSWLNEDVYTLLESRNAALCFYHYKGFKAPERITADFIYARLHGPAGAYQGSYSDTELAEYAAKFQRWASDGRDVYCYFDNDQKSYAPYNARSLIDMLA